MSQRVTVKHKSPNPLFEKWLTEWKHQAEENNSKMKYTFDNALKTLRKYPIHLNSGKECLILKGFGNTLCSMLDKKLNEYKRNGNSFENKQPSNIQSTQYHINKSPRRKRIKPQINIKSSKSTKMYQPVRGSGAYAILITLIKLSQEPNYSGSTKNEIIEKGRHLSDKSFTKPDPETYYTAWSSMSTLVSKGLILKKGLPAKFSLTDEGELLAVKLIENDNSDTFRNACSNILNKNYENENLELDNVILGQNSHKFVNRTCNDDKIIENNVISSMSTENNSEEIALSQGLSITDTFIFAPGTFDVILLVDTQETSGASRNQLNDETISELTRLDVNFEVRHLKVGDFTWICRERTSKQELVLPYIAERKRMDDLGHSIKDGRFHEQKFRLKQCGIHNLMYIVESYGNNTHTLPLSSLMQGATNTLIQHQFQVKFTQNQRHSMQYLSGYTLMLKHIYEKKTVASCSKEFLIPFNISDDLVSLMTFNDFNKGASKVKKFKVKDVFIRQLLQLKGISVEKALAISEKYPTPKLLKVEYDRLGAQGEKLISSILYGPLQKAIGPVISRTIFQLYTIDKLL